ncbi:MAG: HEPN domain-containing protein [Flavobacteriaceae bacterium]|nr:HEPN domain-containing protein [Flavobacteriaceae bacterium]
MKKSEISNSAEMFLYKSTVDFNTANFLFESFEQGKVEIDLEIIMFHLQQTAEKLLKSILSYKKIRIQKTHDISQLIGLCSEYNITFNFDIHSLANLTDFAVDGRYAIMHDDLSDVDKYIKILDNFLESVKTIISG